MIPALDAGALVFPPFAAYATAAAVLAWGRKPRAREAASLAGAALAVASLAPWVPRVAAGERPEVVLLRVFSGASFALRADPYGLVFALVASSLWFATTVYSIGYMRGLREHAQTRYYASFAAAVGSALGVALAANLLTLYVFYEALTLATYPLVVHKESAEALRAGRKYLAYTLTAGLLLLAGTVALYWTTGTLEFRPGGIGALESAPRTGVRVLFWLLVAGFGVKAALVPLHGWLPTAMIAPTPVSALLHAVAVVKAGVFGCVRMVAFVFGPSLLSESGDAAVLCGIASVTILAGSLLALVQDNLKRRLAFSTVSQLSYIVLGAALLTPSGWLGSGFHLVNHAFLKITLFFCAGAIYVETGYERVSELGGIGRRMPLTMLAFALASLGLAGIPPMGAFWSKWYLCLGSLEAHEIVFALVLVASGLLNLAYFVPIVYVAFFGRRGTAATPTEARPSLLFPLLATAVVSVLLGLWPGLGFGLFELVRAALPVR
ncbi:MAG: cation:proton antiporter [Candidatus Binatia bacterium]|nr:MAG: cation:proton antiporter [Candidatus Binatia bacterium]